MPPQESTHLLGEESEIKRSNLNVFSSQLSFTETSSAAGDGARPGKRLVVAGAVLMLSSLVVLGVVSHNRNSLRKPIGPYKLVECQEGSNFFSHYDFFDGPDSLGSAGYNTYIEKSRATTLGLANVTKEADEDFVFIQSKPTSKGPRESVRLEGKRRFDRGLFVLDLRHLPVGCGVWPAFWLTDEANWPANGEIDIVEGVNLQNVVKTALHTSSQCSMYAHVPEYSKTGTWDHATGIPDTFTGYMDFDTKVPADDCWVMAPHQWANQGCAAISRDNETLGEPLNANGGGVYVLEWDPSNKYIKSWVFSPHTAVPENLQQAMATASYGNPRTRVMPEPETWGLPYAYFAIGNGTGCSTDHFKDMRLVINLAFCGTVSGNRFMRDCPTQADEFGVDKDPVATCNAYIESEPEILDEAYWKIRGVYVYERDWARMSDEPPDDESATPAS